MFKAVRGELDGRWHINSFTLAECEKVREGGNVDMSRQADEVEKVAIHTRSPGRQEGKIKCEEEGSLRAEGEAGKAAANI